jgi:energy-coupling factor transporter ATP-binding protein EcfA2
MLTRATFANYKALRNVAVDLTQFTVIVGKNGAGKTSVLQAIHTLAQVPHAQPLTFKEAHDPRRTVTRPRTGPMRISIADASGQTFSLTAHFEANADDSDRYRLVAELAGDKPVTVDLSPPQDADPDTVPRVGARAEGSTPTPPPPPSSASARPSFSASTPASWPAHRSPPPMSPASRSTARAWPRS